MTPVWSAILSKYSIAFIGQCEKAVDFAQDLVGEWLATGMFQGDEEGTGERVAGELGNHKKTKQHDRHILIDEARKIGLKVKALEEDQELQDIVLSLHHCYMNTFAHNPKVIKITENHKGNMIVFNG